MSSVAQIRSGIVTVMQSVPTPLGVIHEYERFASRESDFRALYESGGRINGWHVRRIATRRRRHNLKIEVLHEWLIRGYLSLDDETQSEHQMDTQIEALTRAFENNNLNGAVERCSNGELSGLQLASSEPVMFAGVLCHQAVCQLYTRHYETQELQYD